MYTARPFSPNAAEYQAIAEVHSADWPGDPATASIWEYEDAQRDTRYHFERCVVVVEADQQIVAECSYGEESWSHVPGKYFFSYAMHPDHQGEAIQHVLYEFVTDQLAGRTPAPSQLYAYSREDRPVRNDFLRDKGFSILMREPRSILDVSSFDHGRFADAEKSACRDGLELMSLAAYQPLDPDWARKCWQLRLEIDQDIPWPDPVKPMSFEEFLKKFNHPYSLADAHFIAVDKQGGTDPSHWQMVGMTQVGVDPAHTEKVYQWMTGVRRAYRRKGLATALKVRLIRYVEASGARFIETDNDENNPMFEINLTLGFEPQPALLALCKKFGL